MIATLPSQIALAIDFNPNTEHLLPFYREGSQLTISSTCSSTIILQGDGNEERAFRYFIDRGLTQEQSAGIVGNLIAESGVDPEISQIGGGPGRGIAQWETGAGSGRWEIYLDFARVNNFPILELGSQLEYLWFELSGEPETPGIRGGTEARAFEDLLSQDTVFGAAESFMTQFERPRDQSQEKIAGRAALAQSVFNSFASAEFSSSSSGSSFVAGGSCSVSTADNCPTEPVPRSEVVEIDDANGGIVLVHRCVAESFSQLFADASADGVPLAGFGGWRDIERQRELRVTNGCPDVNTAPSSSCRTPTAIPGRSLHERGIAIDFRLGNQPINSHASPGFQWLDANAGRYGFKNLPSEPWHWSTTGR